MSQFIRFHSSQFVEVADTDTLETWMVFQVGDRLVAINAAQMRCSVRGILEITPRIWT